MWFLRVVMLLALIVWIGGIIFFAFVVAPTLFVVLSNPAEAGAVVGPSLTRLHYIGIISGMVFLICSLAYDWIRHAQLRVMHPIHVFVVLMVMLTAVSQFVVTLRMRALRSQAGTIQTSDRREEFNRLHAWSTRLEAGVLLLGLGVVGLAARRFGNPGT